MQDNYYDSHVLNSKIDRNREQGNKSIERTDRVRHDIGDRSKSRPGSYTINETGIANSYLINPRSRSRINEYSNYTTVGPPSYRQEPNKAVSTTRKVHYNVPKSHHIKTESHEPQLEKVSVKRNSATHGMNNSKYIKDITTTPNSTTKVYNQTGKTSFFSNNMTQQNSPPLMVESARKDTEVRIITNTSHLIEQIQKLTTTLSKKENEVKNNSITINTLEQTISSLNFKLNSVETGGQKDKYVITELKSHFVQLEKKNSDLLQE